MRTTPFAFRYATLARAAALVVAACSEDRGGAHHDVTEARGGGTSGVDGSAPGGREATGGGPGSGEGGSHAGGSVGVGGVGTGGVDASSGGSSATGGKHGSSGGAASGGSNAGGSASATGCGHAGAKTGDFHLSTQDGRGETRDYEALVPDSYDPATPLAVAFVYHGAGGSEEGAKAFGLQNAAAAGEAAIWVFPQGVPWQSYGVGWDDTCGGYDVVFFDHMLAKLEADYCVDPKRIFAAGFSWGCDHVTALACCRGNIVRAIAAASCSDEFADTSNFETYWNLPCPTPVSTGIYFTHDANGDSGYPKADFDVTSALYASWSGCSPGTTPTGSGPCVRHDGCKNSFVECSYRDLGHSPPPNWGADVWRFWGAL